MDEHSEMKYPNGKIRSKSNLSFVKNQYERYKKIQKKKNMKREELNYY